VASHNSFLYNVNLINNCADTIEVLQSVTDHGKPSSNNSWTLKKNTNLKISNDNIAEKMYNYTVQGTTASFVSPDMHWASSSFIKYSMIVDPDAPNKMNLMVVPKLHGLTMLTYQQGTIEPIYLGGSILMTKHLYSYDAYSPCLTDFDFFYCKQ
ncbi:hypothetical protein PMAYCL1PPCAC_22078, partial [Pristionchus mayeri]